MRSWQRRAAAFLGSTEPRTPVSRQAVLADACLALTAVLAVLALAEANFFGTTARGRRAVLTMAVLAARRLAPLACFWVILDVILVVQERQLARQHRRGGGRRLLRGRLQPVPPPGAAEPAAAGLILTAAYQDTRRRCLAGCPPSSILLAITVIGNAVRVWRVRAADSGTRLLQAQAEHEAATRRALELERARIASELHDVVTHNVSVMVVQAGAARQVLRPEQEEARSAMLAVEASGRTAMAELQHMLSLLSVPDQARPAARRGQRAAASAARAGPAHDADPADGGGRAGCRTVRPRRAVDAAAGPGPRRVPGDPGGAHQRAQARGHRPDAGLAELRARRADLEVTDDGPAEPGIPRLYLVADAGLSACGSGSTCAAASSRRAGCRAAGGASWPGSRPTRPRRRVMSEPASEAAEGVRERESERQQPS